MSTDITPFGPQVILLDLDSVVYDWEPMFRTICYYLAKREGIPEFFPPAGELMTWDFYTGDERIDALITEAFSARELYLHGGAMEGAVEAVHQMLACGFKVYFVTTPDPRNEHCIAGKIDFVKWAFGDAFEKLIIFTHDKTAIKGNVLIDDRPDINGAFEPEWKRVVFDQSYNQHITDPRITRWDDWFDGVAHALIDFDAEEAA